MAKDKAAKRAPAVEASIGHLLHRAAQRALDLYVEEAGAGSVTQRQHAVLAAVSAREGAAQADLLALLPKGKREGFLEALNAVAAGVAPVKKVKPPKPEKPARESNPDRIRKIGKKKKKKAAKAETAPAE